MSALVAQIITQEDIDEIRALMAWWGEHSKTLAPVPIVSNPLMPRLRSPPLPGGTLITEPMVWDHGLPVEEEQ